MMPGMSRWPPESPAGAYQRLANQCRANARDMYALGEHNLGVKEDNLAVAYQRLVDLYASDPQERAALTHDEIVQLLIGTYTRC